MNAALRSALLAGFLAQPADSPAFPLFVVLTLGGVPMAIGWIVAIVRVGLVATLPRAFAAALGGALIALAAYAAGGYELGPIGALCIGVPACLALAVYVAASPGGRNESS